MGPGCRAAAAGHERGARLTAAGRTPGESRAPEQRLPCTAWGRLPRRFPLRPASPPQPRHGHEQTPLTAAARQPSPFLLAHSLPTDRHRDLGGRGPLRAALARRRPAARRGSPDGTYGRSSRLAAAREKRPEAAPRPAPPAPRPRSPPPLPPRGHLPAPRAPHAAPRPARRKGAPRRRAARRACAWPRSGGRRAWPRAAAPPPPPAAFPRGRRGSGPPARHRAAPHAAGARGDPPSARGLGGPSRRPPHAALPPVRPRVGSGPRPRAAHGFPALPGARRGRPLRRRLPK